MVTCQSTNQLKTPAKVSWAFKMFSQFGSLGYTITGEDCWSDSCPKTIIDTLHKEDKPQTFIAKKLAVHRVLYPSMLTESWVEGKRVEEKDAQPAERTADNFSTTFKFIEMRLYVCVYIYIYIYIYIYNTHTICRYTHYKKWLILRIIFVLFLVKISKNSYINIFLLE